MSLPDTVFIFVLALIIFGPKKLPEIGRQIGRLVGEFRRASNEFKFQIEEELRQVDVLEKRTSPPEISRPVAEPAIDKDSSTLPMLSQEPSDPAEILPVGQYPNIATLDTAELDPSPAPLSELNGASVQVEIPETAEQTTAYDTYSAPSPITITPAPGSQPRTTQPFAASAPPAESFPEPSFPDPLLEPSLEPVVPANRPPSRAEAEVTHG